MQVQSNSYSNSHVSQFWIDGKRNGAEFEYFRVSRLFFSVSYCTFTAFLYICKKNTVAISAVVDNSKTNNLYELNS